MIIALMTMMLGGAAYWPWTGANDPPAHVIALGRDTIVNGRWGGRPVRVEFALKAVANCRDAAWLRGAVADRQDRCLSLGKLGITAGGKPMMLSSSSYADLGGINDVVVRFAPSRLFIYMRGPSGADYYGATLEFDRSDIVSRRLDLADGSVETTTYRAGKPFGQ